MDSQAIGEGSQFVWCWKKESSVCRKGKFGLNPQAVSDVHGRILDNLIVRTGAMSDCLAFEGSDIYQQLECGLLHDMTIWFSLETMP